MNARVPRGRWADELRQHNGETRPLQTLCTEGSYGLCVSRTTLRIPFICSAFYLGKQTVYISTNGLFMGKRLRLAPWWKANAGPIGPNGAEQSTVFFGLFP